MTAGTTKGLPDRSHGQHDDPAAEVAFDRLIAEIRACAICVPHLPLGPRPVLRGRPSARLLIISQAPGTRVHETGLSFNDRSGDRLRAWLALDRETFYDETRVAIMPMGFCYPGRDGKGGDAATPRMRSTIAPAVTRAPPGRRADPSRWRLRDRLLPPGLPNSLDDRGDRSLAQRHTGGLRSAASELAHDTLAARQPVVRERGIARAAPPGSPGNQASGDQSDSSIRAMSSSLKPKWWPISWISTWRTRRAKFSPVSHQ